MTTPYINTRLSTPILLRPHQMNNDIYVNLKKNLEDKVLNKCFSKYGYISKVINIIDYKGGYIEPENTECSARFDVTFSCRLCLPRRNKQIICKLDKVNKMLLTAVNGPIVAIITHDRVSNQFYKDTMNNLRYKKDGESHLLEAGNCIKVTVSQIQFYDNDVKIKIIAYLDSIATEEETKQYYQELYNQNEEEIVEVNFADI